MKKSILLIAAAICSLMAHADDQKGALYLTSPANYQVISISDNGLWACGMATDESGSTTYGFRWNLTSGKIDTFDAETEAYTVSNDGTVAGSYYTADGSTDGSPIIQPGLWKDGAWTRLPLPSAIGGWATAITPDGHYVTGTDNKYVSYIWKDGQLQYTAQVKGIVDEANGTFLTYAISPDGSKIGGWAYYSDDNRNPGYWDTADQQFHELNPGQAGSPWQQVRKFSPDGKKCLFWGGYHQDASNPDLGYGIRAIYDIDSKTSQIVYPLWQDPFNFDLYDMGGNGTITGYIQDDSGMEYAFCYAGGKGYYAEDYLTQRGVDLSALNMPETGDGHHLLFRAMCLSTDEKVWGLLYYDQSYEFHSVIVMMDQDVSMTAPVGLHASQVNGLLTAHITWSEPLGDKSTLQGYNLYRNGQKVNSAVLTATSYYDSSLSVGDYSYTVTAVYAEGESKQSDAATVSIKAITPNPVRNLFARQRGYDGTLTVWDEPNTNYVQARYFQQDAAVEAFGGGSHSFESGVLFPVEQVNLYAGYRLMGVSFYPLSAQGSWAVNIYRHVDGKLTLLRSYPVTQTLNYGEENTVTFASPLTLQSGQDLLIGVQTNVIDESYEVQGVVENCLQVGYTDLLREVGEDDFWSLNTMSQGATYDMAWATTALLAPTDNNADIDKKDHYNIYVDGAKKAETKELSYNGTDLAQGNHTFGVETIYADGRKSDIITASMTLGLNEECLRITPQVYVEDSEWAAQWDAPRDNDLTQMGYCSNTMGSKQPNATESVTELIARVDFTPTELQSYDGYEIKTLSFYPLSNAGFELQIWEGDEMRDMIEADNVVLGAWNHVSLETPITVRKGTTYRFCLVCYDCPAGEPPLALDNTGIKNGYSALLQAGGESGWYSIDEETGLKGNWMMRMTLSNPDGDELAVSGYDVILDDAKKASEHPDTEYAEEFTRYLNARHSLRIDAHYSDLGKTIQGNPVEFQQISTAITDVAFNKGNSLIYNAHGQRVHKDFRGLIITDGKKLFRK